MFKKKNKGSALKHQNSIFGALNLYRPNQEQKSNIKKILRSKPENENIGPKKQDQIIFKIKNQNLKYKFI